MSEQRIDGYLSRKLTVDRLNGDINEFSLHIVKPVYSENENPQSEGISRLRIFMSDFILEPYTSEIPYIIYVDVPLIIKEISLGKFMLTVQET